LFVALNDEAVAVRALAVGVVGRLAAFNPAHVLPALRRHLMQLLNDMDHSPDSRQREGAALPGCLGFLVSHALLLQALLMRGSLNLWSMPEYHVRALRRGRLPASTRVVTARAPVAAPRAPVSASLLLA
jgi:hypothetical protein